MSAHLAAVGFAVLFGTGSPARSLRANCDHLPKTSAVPVTPNDNRTPAGELQAGVLTLRLVITTAAWYPDGPDGCAIEVRTFAEEGKKPQLPGPLIRVPAGTRLHVIVRNTLPDSVFARGFEERPVDQVAPHLIRSGETREFRFGATVPGTYHYAATPAPAPAGITAPANHNAGMIGAFIVDGIGAPTNDRIFVLTRWTPYAGGGAQGRQILATAPEQFFELNTMNGLSFPNTERLVVTQGEPVRWRVINLTNEGHTMHLHGFYFRILSRGTVLRDSLLPAGAQPLAVTEFMGPYRTMLLEWTPDEVGNWIFHCHLVRHMTANQRLDRMPRPGFTREAQHNHEAGHAMAGLVMAVTVQPKSTSEPPTAAAPARRIRLFANQRAGVFGDRPGFAFVAQEGSREPAADSVRIPGSPLILTRGEPTEITVHNRLSFPIAVHWHGLELESYFDGVAGWSGAGTRLAPAVAPGDSFVVRITPRRAGTFIYHVHNEQGRELASGLYGPFLVMEPGRRLDPEHDRVFLISEPGPFSHLGGERAPFVNGTSTPAEVLLAPQRTYRLRFISISANDLYIVSLQKRDAGERVDQILQDPSSRRRLVCQQFGGSEILLTWRTVARDGAELPDQQREVSPACFSTGPGMTVDVELTTDTPGSFVLLVNAVNATSGQPGAATVVPIEVRR